MITKKEAVKWNWNKKGVSAIIGYVLLIVFAVSMSGVVYSWLRRSIPKQQEACPDGVSIEVSGVDHDSGNKEISFTLLNRGLFSINGVTVRIKENERACMVEEVCTNEACSGSNVVFQSENGLTPSSTMNITATYTATCTSPTELELVPMKFLESGQVLCENSIIRERVQ